MADRTLQHIDTVTDLLLELRLLLGTLPSSSTDEELLEVAGALHHVKSIATQTFSEFQTIVAESIDASAPVEISTGTIEVKSGAPRKSWDHSRLAAEVGRRVADRNMNIDSGEMSLSPQGLIQQVLEFVGLSYWKVGKLKELHIDADDFCEVGESKKNLVVRRDV